MEEVSQSQGGWDPANRPRRRGKSKGRGQVGGEKEGEWWRLICRYCPHCHQEFISSERHCGMDEEHGDGGGRELCPSLLLTSTTNPMLNCLHACPPHLLSPPHPHLSRLQLPSLLLLYLLSTLCPTLLYISIFPSEMRFLLRMWHLMKVFFSR